MISGDAEKIRNELRKQTAREGIKFVICPFGELGQFVKQVLNAEYGIKEFLILDNYKSEANIKPVKWLEENKPDYRVVVLLAVRNQDMKRELESELCCNGILDNQIIDVLREPVDIQKDYRQYRASLVINEMDRIFHMKSHDVKFWLPLYDIDCIQEGIVRSDAYYEEK